MDNSQIIQPSTPITHLTTELLGQLTTYDDFIRVYQQINKGESTFSWVKADLFLEMQKKLGMDSLKDLSVELKAPLSTITNYIRVSRGFPNEARNYNLPFSYHLIATRADSYNSKTGEFDGTNRFEWLRRADKEQITSKMLESRIRLENIKGKTDGKLTCVHCDETNEIGEILEYVMYAPELGRGAKKFELHASCYKTIIDFIEYGKKNKD